MPTLASACCVAAPTALLLAEVLVAMTVAKPFGWPHWVSSSLALATSPLWSAPLG